MGVQYSKLTTVLTGDTTFVSLLLFNEYFLQLIYMYLYNILYKIEAKENLEN